MPAEQDETKARYALYEGICPDCLVLLIPYESEQMKHAHMFGTCPSCGGFWVDNDAGNLQVSFGTGSDFVVEIFQSVELGRRKLDFKAWPIKWS